MGTVKRGIHNVARNPVRLVLVVLLLGTSLMFAGAMISLHAGTRGRLAELRGSIGTGIDLRPAGSFGPIGGLGGGATLSAETLRAASQVPGVVGVDERIEREYDGSTLKGAVTPPPGVQIITPSGASTPRDGAIPPLLNGVTPGASDKVSLFGEATATVVAGRGLTAADRDANVALLSEALAKANSLTVGSTFELRGAMVEVVGLYTTGQSFADNSIVLPVRTLQRLYNLQGVSSATVRVADAAQVKAVAGKLRQALGDKVDVATQEELLGPMLDTLAAAGRNIQGALVAGLVTSALVIVFAVVLLVRERTREIGVLKALGASQGHVVGQFGVEVLTLSGLAALVATATLALAGGAVARWFAPSGTRGGPGAIAGPDGPVAIEFGGPGALAGGANPLNAGLTPQTLLLVLGLGVALAVLASAIPAWHVARVRPAEVLRQAAN
ncbi:MAG: hypothetical protein AVDCRST_MAG88-2514 [uncultured Thermomicrobiales bacterium]|uniref:Uncharacterized protein n=1 Tax=uncultured Thermomicrobiales bacterium TaxID=1645740 RepID=A0A6J4VBY8_9BACT|nr:MAG: hypothetical protein AVDCRST_MAG88-2514 [uncultured Thermomicrobiales bacterium]